MNRPRLGLPQTMLLGRSELLRRHLDRFTPALNRAVKGDVRALHRTRVASRRLRELLPVLQLDRDMRRKLARRLRKVTTRLGTVRELDVLVMLIEELHLSRPDHSQALSRVAVSVTKARDAARDRLFDRLPAEDLRRVARKLAGLVDDLEEVDRPVRRTPADGWRWAVDARMAVRAARLTSAIVEAGAVYLPERLHTVRIALKKLRYSAELANEVVGGKPSADLRALKRAQDTLGRLHDLQVLIDRVRHVQASLAPPSMTVWRALDQLVIDLDNDCRQLHGRYMRQRTRLEDIAARFSARPENAHPQGVPVQNRRGVPLKTERRSSRRPVAV
jgi:CHAD domain-containing protein